jgi:AcrR family transcriptional regulator
LRARRAEETRAALVATAHRLFLTNGWAGTGMREVAAEAGVAIETVYAYFSSKRGLFKAVTDVAVVGDDQPVALAERTGFAAMGQGRRADRLAAAARVVVGVNARVAGLVKVLQEAAASDEALAGELRAARERQRGDVAAAFQLIVGREPTVTERDGLWALISADVYLLLVEESGWTSDAYEAWLADAFERLIPRAASPKRRND